MAIAQTNSLKDRRSESLSLGTLGRFYELIRQANLAKQYSSSALEISQQIDAADLSY